jgi:hypothetical protein
MRFKSCLLVIVYERWQETAALHGGVAVVGSPAHGVRLARFIDMSAGEGSMDKRQLVVAAAVVALLNGGCGDSPITGPTVASIAAPDSAASTHGATTEFEEFQFSPTIRVPAPCLGGGTFVITGTVSGWARITTTPNGQVHLMEKWDFSQLTGSHGGSTWTAAPGSGEMFSFNNLPGVGGTGTPVSGVVHQGRSRFIADGEAPDVFFIHRFRILRLPSGEFQFRRVETEVAEIQCVGA